MHPFVADAFVYATKSRSTGNSTVPLPYRCGPGNLNSFACGPESSPNCSSSVPSPGHVRMVSGASRGTTTAHMDMVRGLAERLPRTGTMPMQGLQRIIDLLFNPMLRSDDNRTERDKMRVRGTAVIHRHAEKSRSPVRLAIGSDFLDVPTHRFFPLVDTRDELKARDLFHG